MEINDFNIEAIIRKAADEVLNKIVTQPLNGEKAFEKGINDTRILVLIPDTPGKLELYLNYLASSFPDSDLTIGTYINLNPQVIKHLKKVVDLKNEAQREELAAIIGSFEEILCVFPGIKRLKNITDSDDSGFIEKLMIYSLLHGKKVKLLLDFCINDLPLNPLTKGIRDILSSLASIGIKVEEVCSKREKSEGIQFNSMELITEEIIEEIWHNGSRSIQCGKGCILTPLAKDRASELGMEIVFRQ